MNLLAKATSLLTAATKADADDLAGVERYALRHNSAAGSTPTIGPARRPRTECSRGSRAVSVPSSVDAPVSTDQKQGALFRIVAGVPCSVC
jgi:hypothetical protein